MTAPPRLDRARRGNLNPRALKRPVLLLALSAIPLAGCAGSAVIVQRTDHGGLLALEGERAPAMADARRQMSEACAGAYTILGERRAITGMHHGEEIVEELVAYTCGAGADPPPKKP